MTLNRLLLVLIGLFINIWIFNIEKGGESSKHIYSETDEKLKNLIKTNYIKSIFISNIAAVYMNYIRKNKSFGKFCLSNYIKKLYTLL